VATPRDSIYISFQGQESDERDSECLEQSHCRGTISLSMKDPAKEIPGYDYGANTVGTSSISLKELDELKISVGLKAEDELYLRLAGDVLGDQVKQVVEHWRSRIIASIPHLARHTRSPEGNPLPEYLAKSNQRFEQWILDTCLRPYDQTWLDYQQEIALRHTSLKKNQVDNVQSTGHVPLRDIIAFIPVMNETIKPYLAAKGHSSTEVEKMHLAWCKSLQLQIALWTSTYTKRVPAEW
jgi:protoglobin